MTVMIELINLWQQKQKNIKTKLILKLFYTVIIKRILKWYGYLINCAFYSKKNS